jgi:hypothetical protein
MINHMRTLLLNQNDATGGLQSGNPGAELVDAGFQPQQLPQLLSNVRAAILPTGYTPYQQNIVLAYMMHILHQPELAPYTIAPDTRVTYTDTAAVDAYLHLAADVQRWRDTGCDTDVVYATTSDKRWDAPGTIMHWTLRHITDSPDTVELRYEDGQWVEHRVQFDGQYTAPIQLVPEYVSIRLHSPTSVLSGDCVFNITVNAPVTPDGVEIFDRLRRLELRNAATGTLFDTYPPYATQLGDLRQIWDNSHEMLLRIGAYVLAFAFQLERLRLGIAVPRDRSTLRQVTV